MSPSTRKARTEALLQKIGIPYNPGLPCIETEAETELRTSEEIGLRILCLNCVIGTAYHPSDSSYKRYLKRYRLWKHLTPDELSFMSNPAPEHQACMALTWRVEALFVLMWSVRLFKILPFPTHQVENQRLIDKFPSFNKSPRPFINSLRLRPKSTILDKSDLIYRLHWATTQAQIDGQPSPGGLDPEIVYEWHYAINWVTKYDDADWDRVSTDT
jgi:hypothetical protein